MAATEGRATLSIYADEHARLRGIESFCKRVLAQNGDDVCWRDWHGNYAELAALLGVEFKPVLLDKARMMRNCGHFVECLLSGSHYAAPPDADAERLAWALDRMIKAFRRFAPHGLRPAAPLAVLEEYRGRVPGPGPTEGEVHEFLHKSRVLLGPDARPKAVPPPPRAARPEWQAVRYYAAYDLDPTAEA